ncbi:MAG TPA: CHASE3 domain-containing protein, partial [Polyangia bacterium]|nr:CHASE3 domain-containing protein [Polyangia bacterium]
MWTFGRKIAAGFALALVMLAAIGTVAYRCIDRLTSTSYLVTHSHIVREHIASTLAQLRDAESGQRGFVITGNDEFLDIYHGGSDGVIKTEHELRELTADNPHQQKRLDEAEPRIAAKLAELKRTVEMRRAAGFEATQKVVAEGDGKRHMEETRRILKEMDAEELDLLRQRSEDVESASSMARQTIAYGTGFALLLMVVAGITITRSLTDQIGAAVRHVQSSSAELQAAANQQATGAKEQATAMSEITTTISELLATSRQIAESAQRVAQIAGETVSAARDGDLTVHSTQESVGAIKRQVDVIVAHMLELGKKSQQIGGILEIINE